MKAFEYIDSSDSENSRNELGKQGWECYAVSVVEHLRVFHFKRLIESESAKLKVAEAMNEMIDEEVAADIGKHRAQGEE